MAQHYRYEFDKIAYNSDQLSAEIRALNVPGFVGLLGDETFVVALFEQSLSEQQASAIAGVVIAHTPDPNRERNQRAAAAVATLQSATDPISVAVRGALSYAFTLLNDEREARSLPRLTEQQIYSGIVGFIAGGAGEPTPNPIAPIGG